MQLEYEHEIVINLSRFDVVEYFTNPHTLKEWFISGDYEFLEGKPGQPGAITRFRHTTTGGLSGMGSSTTEYIHTVIKNDLPYEYVSTLESKGVKTTSYSYFQEEAPNVTRWINRNEVELSGFAKKMKTLTVRISSKLSQRMMRRFKKHAEKAYRTY
jgi:hypothetical protein